MISNTVRDTLDTPLQINYGAGERTNLVFTLPARVAGPGSDGFGDIALGFWHRFVDDDAWPSVALVALTKLPTGTRSGSSDEVDFVPALALTKDLGGVASTLYYELAVIGEPQGGTKIEHSVALLAEVPLTRRWGLFLEGVSTFAIEDDREVVFGNVGLAYATSESLSFDVGAAIGLNHGAPDLEVFAGFTWGFGGERPPLFE